MNRGAADSMGRTAELRRAFDRSFAELPSGARPELEDLLAIRVEGDPYAIRLAEVASLIADKAITPLPGSTPDLCGVAGFRGSIVPVYDLRCLLGYRVSESPRWLVLARGSTPVGLAFDRFDGHLRVPREAIAAEEKTPAATRYLREVVRTDGLVRSIVHLPSVLEAIVERARTASPRTKER